MQRLGFKKLCLAQGYLPSTRRDQVSNPGKPEQKLRLWLPLLGFMVVPDTTFSGLPVPDA